MKPWNKVFGSRIQKDAELGQPHKPKQASSTPHQLPFNYSV